MQQRRPLGFEVRFKKVIFGTSPSECELRLCELDIFSLSWVSDSGRWLLQAPQKQALTEVIAGCCAFLLLVSRAASATLHNKNMNLESKRGCLTV